MYNILCVVVAINPTVETLMSVKNQTLEVKKLVIANKPYPEYSSVGEKIGQAMRDVLDEIDLSDYNYVLRLDGDTVLPDNFLEENIKINADLLGWGYAQLFSVPVFVNLLNGVFPIVFSDDSYLERAFRLNGYKVSKYVVDPILPMPKKYPLSDYFLSGIERYKLGLSFFNALASFRNRRSSTLIGFMFIIITVGWVFAFISGVDKYNFC